MVCKTDKQKNYRSDYIFVCLSKYFRASYWSKWPWRMLNDNDLICRLFFYEYKKRERINDHDHDHGWSYINVYKKGILWCIAYLTSFARECTKMKACRRLSTNSTHLIHDYLIQFFRMIHSKHDVVNNDTI